MCSVEEVARFFFVLPYDVRAAILDLTIPLPPDIAGPTKALAYVLQPVAAYRPPHRATFDMWLRPGNDMQGNPATWGFESSTFSVYRFYTGKSTDQQARNPRTVMDTPTVHLLDYVAGNVRSLVNAIEKLGFSVEWVKEPADIPKAEVHKKKKKTKKSSQLPYSINQNVAYNYPTETYTSGCWSLWPLLISVL